LHQRDNARLLETLKRLRDLGNTVIVVEHDEDAIRAADHVLDIGPGAGILGGQIIAQGTPDDIMAHPDSLTGQYLTGEKRIAVPSARRQPRSGTVTIEVAASSGCDTISARALRIESAAGWGEMKKNTRMVAEGSVLVSAGEPRGAADESE